MITAKQLCDYAKQALGHPYWYGTYGQISTKALYSSKKKQYPKMYQWALPSNQLNTRVFDCVGLEKGAIWSGGDFSKNPRYNPAQDVSANGMLEKCKTKGKIKTMPDKAGVLVFMNGHTGIYIGNGYVIEARGHAYGVVKTKLKGRGWKNWGLCPWVDYTEKKEVVSKKENTTPKPKPSASIPQKKPYGGNFPKLVLGRALKFGSSGNNVKRLQKFLNWYGNYKLDVDGAYGRKTESAVRDFQAKNGLAVDGKFGKKSLAKAMGIRK